MNSGILAAIIIVSLFAFISAAAIVMFSCFRFRKQQQKGKMSSRVAARIGRMQDEEEYPTSPTTRNSGHFRDDTFDAEDDLEGGRTGKRAEEDEEDDTWDAADENELDEFGNDRRRRSQSSSINTGRRKGPVYDAKTGATIKPDGTRSYLKGWFGLDPPSLDSRQSSRANRLKREREIENSLPRSREQRNQIHADSSSDEELYVPGAENELGETEEEEDARLAA